MSPFFVILAVGSAVLAQEWKSGPISVEISADPGPFTLAEVCEVRLIVSVPALSLEETLRTGEDRLYRLEKGSEPWLRIGGLHLLSGGPETAETVRDGVVRTVSRYRFEPRRTGDFEIPARDLVFASIEAPSVTLRTKPLRFRVRGLVTGDPLQVAPRPVLDLPRAEGDGREALCLVLLLVTGSCLWIWRERADSSVAVADRVDPREAALRQLAESKEPSRWRDILLAYAGADLESPQVAVPGSDAELGQILEDLDRFRFGRQGVVGRKALRKRLETFIRDRER
jgi:hypothetical protein